MGSGIVSFLTSVGGGGGSLPPKVITLPADFPTTAEANNEIGRIYIAAANVTDNDATKTNTGQSFLSGEEFVWDGVSAYALLGPDAIWLDNSTYLSTINVRDLGATGARIPKIWLTDLEITNVPTIGGTSLDSLYAVKAGLSGGQTINGSTLTTETLVLHNNAVDGLGLTIDGSGDVVIDGTVLTDNILEKGTGGVNIDFINIKDSAISQTSPGKLILDGGVTGVTISTSASIAMSSYGTFSSFSGGLLSVNTVTNKSGSNLTLMAGVDLDLSPTGNITIPTDSKKLLFGAGDDASLYYDGTDFIVNPKEVGAGLFRYAAHPTFANDTDIVDKKYVDDAILVEDLWNRVGTELTPKNAGDDVDMKVGKIITGDDTDANYTVLEYANVATNNPFVEWSQSIAGLTGPNIYGLHMYVQDASKGAGLHIDSEQSEGRFVLNTRAAATEVNSFMGRLSDGIFGSGTRLGWNWRYNPTSSYVTLEAVSGTTYTDVVQFNPGTEGQIEMLGTGALILQSGTTAQRSGSPVNGMHRYNSDDSRHEFYEDGAWVNYLTEAAENLWDRSGTSLIPHTAGDDIGATGTRINKGWFTAIDSSGLSVAANTDVTTTLGRVLIDSRVSDIAYFSHVDQSASTDYAIRQETGGSVRLNAPVGQSVVFAMGGATKGTMSDTSFDFQQTVTLSGGANLGLTGNRLTKGWFTNLEVTNMPTVGGTSINANGALSLTSAEVSILSGKTLSTGATNNDKLVTQGYTEDAIAEALGGTNFDYFFSDTAEGVIANYNLMYPADTGEAQSTVAMAIPSADTLIKTWITEVTEPTFVILIEGIYDIHIHAAKTAGTEDVNIYGELYKRASGGTETLLATTESSPILTGSNTAYTLHFSLDADENLAVDDRLVVKFYGTPSGAGTEPTATLYLEGTNDSRISIRTTSDALDGRYLVKVGLTGGQTVAGTVGFERRIETPNIDINFYEEFIGSNFGEVWTENGTGAIFTLFAEKNGSMRCQTAAVSGRNSYLDWGYAASSGVFEIVPRCEMEHRRVQEDITNLISRACMLYHNDDNLVCFNLTTATSGNWRAQVRVGASDTFVDTTITADTNYHIFKIVTDDTNCTFYIDGTQRAQIATPIGLKTLLYQPRIGQVETTDGVSKGTRTDYVNLTVYNTY